MAIHDDLKQVFRSYKRAASRLRDLVVDSGPDDLAIKFELRAEQGQTAMARFTSGSRVARQAALLRPFMPPGRGCRHQVVAWTRSTATTGRTPACRPLW